MTIGRVSETIQSNRVLVSTVHVRQASVDVAAEDLSAEWKWFIDMDPYLKEPDKHGIEEDGLHQKNSGSLLLEEADQKIGPRPLSRSMACHDTAEEEATAAAARLAQDRGLWTTLCRHHKLLGFILALLVFMALLLYPMNDNDEPTEKNCLAILVFVSILWSTEAFPLFATALILPFLIVALRVLRDAGSGERLDPTDASAVIFHAMFSQVIMLLLGGFSIASALEKYHIDRMLSMAVLKRSGASPIRLLFAVMFLVTLSSMWLSNIAAPVLCYSVLSPILQRLPLDSPLVKAIVIGTAVAANIGGMMSPISSPQNVFAIDLMSQPLVDSRGEPLTAHHAGVSPSWLQWLAVSVPVCLLSDLFCWVFMVFFYRLRASNITVPPLIEPSPSQPWSKQQTYVVTVTLLTIALWCCGTWLNPYVGPMGVLAIFPLIAFFATGILKKEDFNGFLWNVVILAMGGLALGEAVKSSGLLSSIARRLGALVAAHSLYAICILFALFVLFITTFISHTVGAMILLPIVQNVGTRAVASATSSPHPQLLVFVMALTCSAGMGLPISGFPNMNAVAQENDQGQNYIHTKDFCFVGIPCSIIVFVLILSVGYGLLLALDY